MGHGGGCGENAPVPGSAETAAERAANPEVRAEAPVRGTQALVHVRGPGARVRGTEGASAWARRRVPETVCACVGRAGWWT